MTHSYAIEPQKHFNVPEEIFMLPQVHKILNQKIDISQETLYRLFQGE